MDTKIITYLACPYSHPNFEIRLDRYEKACKVAAILMKHPGLVVFSPISHSFEMCQHGVDGGFEAWEDLDYAILGIAREMIVLTLDGWEDSEGVDAEIGFTKHHEIPTTYWSLRQIERGEYKP